MFQSWKNTLQIKEPYDKKGQMEALKLLPKIDFKNLILQGRITEMSVILNDLKFISLMWSQKNLVILAYDGRPLQI